ncbi:MAG: mandelate racemase/muconate lactonizing enzyme family protein [Nitrososphaerota archaeon]
MRITDVHLIPLMTYEESISAGPGAALVEVETDEGITGVGEACIHSERGEAALAVQKIVEIGFKPLVVGENPFDIQRLWLKLYSYCEWYGRAGVATYALSGIDVALWDICGKALGVPVYTLLGGRFRDKIPVYASLLFDMDDPEGTAKVGKEYVKLGYRAVKYGWGKTRERAFGMNLDKDEEMIRTIREVLGQDIQIMVDVGRFVNLTPAQAIKLAKRLEKYNIFWLEEPLPPEDVTGYKMLSDAVDIYIAAGESEYSKQGFLEYITRRAVDIIQPDVTKAGGLTEAKKIVDFCEAWNLMMVPHGFSSAVNVAANLQLVASMPRAFILEYRRTPSPLISRLSKKPFTYEDGCLKIPTEPGLGIQIDYSVVEECSVKQ